MKNLILLSALIALFSCNKELEPINKSQPSDNVKIVNINTEHLIDCDSHSPNFKKVELFQAANVYSQLKVVFYDKENEKDIILYNSEIQGQYIQILFKLTPCNDKELIRLYYLKNRSQWIRVCPWNEVEQIYNF